MTPPEVVTPTVTVAVLPAEFRYAVGSRPRAGWKRVGRRRQLKQRCQGYERRYRDDVWQPVLRSDEFRLRRSRRSSVVLGMRGPRHRQPYNDGNTPRSAPSFIECGATASRSARTARSGSTTNRRKRSVELRTVSLQSSVVHQPTNPSVSQPEGTAPCGLPTGPGSVARTKAEISRSIRFPPVIRSRNSWLRAQTVRSGLPILATMPSGASRPATPPQSPNIQSPRQAPNRRHQRRSRRQPLVHRTEHGKDRRLANLSRPAIMLYGA
jgi:hypothetical protein